MLNKMKFHKPLLIVMLVVLSVTLFPSTTFAEESNKAEVRAGLAQGGWYVVYGDLINEADYAAFLAAVGTAVATENPQPIYQFFDYQLQAQVAKIKQNAPELVEEALADMLLRAFESQGEVFRNGNLEFSAGVATYKRWEKVSYDEPRTKTCWTNGIIKTKYPCITMERVEIKDPYPNNHQPYIRYRWVSGEQTNLVSASSGRQVYFLNNCSAPIKLALRYKQTNGEWITKGWWNVHGNDHNYLASGGSNIRTNNSWFYYYAQSTDGSNRIWGGQEFRTFGSQDLGMRKTQLTPDSNGNFALSISCD